MGVISRWFGFAALAFFVILLGIRLFTADGDRIVKEASLALQETELEPSFARAIDIRAFRFPDDHGPHPEFQTEWWYYTGNLKNTAGDQFGYQLTFFRRALTPVKTTRDSSFAADQVYFAHFALTDVRAEQHDFFERFSRSAAGLAGAANQPFGVWLEDWRVEALNSEASVVRLVAHEGDIGIDLKLSALKPIVAHGLQGLSQKSEEPGNASYYLSFTRMQTTGEITISGVSQEVKGESWFDHEWSTSALGSQAVGWDWFSIQLSDGRELMLYEIRRVDGTRESVSAGSVIEPDGQLKSLSKEEYQVDVLDLWQSPETGGEYPSGWRIQIPGEEIELVLEPWIQAQEMRVSFIYWEGAVAVRGVSNGEPVVGHGYVELTGYLQSMQGVF